MPSPEGVEAVPFFQQVATGVILGVGGVGMMVWRFISGKKKDPEPEKVVVQDGTAINWKPMLDEIVRIRQGIEGMRDDTHEILMLARQEAQDDQVERKAQERAERIVARERAVYEDRVHDDLARRMLRLPKDD